MRKILIEGMSENLGGVETFIHLLFCTLKDSWKIDFITVNDKIPFEEEFLSQGCKIHRITPRYKSVKQFRIDIDRVFAENKYDVFWANKTTLSSSYSVISARKYEVKKVILHSHQSKNMGTFLTLVLHLCNRMRVCRYVDIKAACSQVAAEWFFGKNTEDVQIFPNAVDVSAYEPNSKQRDMVKEKLGLSGKFLVGSVARFAPEKNHAKIIEIFAELVKKNPDAHLILCGTGQLMDATRQLVKEKGIEKSVSFLGARKDMPDIYQAMDVFLMPSLFEGLPFTLVEAQASGIPCVVSDTVSKEAELTDIIEYLPLDRAPEVWAEHILAWRDYKKCSKREQLNEKGFTLEAFSEKVGYILKEIG